VGETHCHLYFPPADLAGTPFPKRLLGRPTCTERKIAPQKSADGRMATGAARFERKKLHGRKTKN
jgi:hypothetical protein